MAFTYSKLAETTVGVGGTSTITFNNIPQNYTDLVLKLSARGTGAYNYNTMNVIFNGQSTGYSGRVIYGSGGSPASTTRTILETTSSGATATASTFGNVEMYIPNYTSSNQKSVSIDGTAEDNSATNFLYMFAGLSTSTSAIISMTLYADGGSSNFAQYSTATLYGVRIEL